MPNVVTPFTRKRAAGREAGSTPRHRRDGWFDEQDRWHDSEENDAQLAHHAQG